MSPVQLLDSALFASVIERARQSPRLRPNHNFHTSMDDNPHRFLNVMVRGTHNAPHRHHKPPKSESFIVLEGELAFFTFDDAGEVTSTHVLGRNAVGADIQPGVCHTIAVLSEHVVCFEVKPGPYSAANDKDFAPWAPREGDAAAGAYLEGLVEGAGACLSHPMKKRSRGILCQAEDCTRAVRFEWIALRSYANWSG